MQEKNHNYICIDLKSFYASVECIERSLDPLNTNLVVADSSRTEKTICLAVSPSLKSYGISGRARLFQVVEKVKEVNALRRLNTKKNTFEGSSVFDDELKENKELALDYIIAPPRMALYMEYSTRIYDVYLKYIAHEDMQVYSIDEVFFDVTAYLKTYDMTPRQLAEVMIKDVYETTGITATAGIGTNLYLAKIAMDIVAKHVEPNENGARIAELDEMSYKQLLWNHTPITDFWRVGKGYATKLKKYGMNTMGDVARCSLGKEEDFYNEDLLFELFGVNAELLIDHAWGYEPCTMQDIKNYVPMSSSISTRQVLHCPYDAAKARIIVQEMTDNLILDLVDKRIETNQIVLTIGYDIENLTNEKIKKNYHGEIVTDRYNRKIPKHAHGTTNLCKHTSSEKIIMRAVLELYDRIMNPDLLVRRITINACHLQKEGMKKDTQTYQQMNLLDLGQFDEKTKETEEKEKKEKELQKAVLSIKKRYGKNAILKGTNFQEGATARDRNRQIGGHKE
ncbi:MAG: DNA methylase [Eubacterium sp.]|nr:DNA methylase [Eubacterium sp.]